ncbi:L-threonylcarbamoyladenylate synthase [Alphaproteobacteria bacterium LSUCC0684]
MAEIVRAGPENLGKAAAYLRSGQLVAFGTETVYGLGGNATDGEAVARIFKAKGRPAFNPLISHLPDVEAAFGLGRPTPLAETLAAAFWPGPMTLVLDQREGCPVSPLATSGLDSIALRVPGAAQARAFLHEAAMPVAAPSANRSGRISPTRALHVADELGDAPELALILDTGPCIEGLESTVIDARGNAPVILRPGSVTAEMIKEVTGLEIHAPGEDILSPGQLASHYAPRTPVALNQPEPKETDAWIGFGEHHAGRARAMFSFSETGDLIEAAARLYDILRQADAAGAERIAIAPIPQGGIGTAINDRLARAAADTAPLSD